MTAQREPREHDREVGEIGRDEEVVSDRLVRLARAASGDPEALRAEAAIIDPDPEAEGDDPPPEWASSPAGRLIERWLPGGTRGVRRLRSVAVKRRGLTAALLVALAAAVGMGVASWGDRPAAESAPDLPAAISVMRGICGLGRARFRGAEFGGTGGWADRGERAQGGVTAGAGVAGGG